MSLSTRLRRERHDRGGAALYLHPLTTRAMSASSLAALGVDGDIPAQFIIAKQADKKKVPETKKQKEVREAKEKLEKKKAKAAKMIAAKGREQAAAPKLAKVAEKKEEKAARAATDASDRVAAAEATQAAVSSAAADPELAAKHTAAISGAHEEARRRAEDAKSFANAYAATGIDPLAVVPMDYTVRAAAELELAAQEQQVAECGRAAEAMARALAASASVHLAKKGCALTQDEFALLVVAAPALN